MQSIGYGLRSAGRRRVHHPTLLLSQVASTSTTPWNTRGYAWEPLTWFQKSVSPKFRKEDNRAEVEEAKEKLRESGQSSIFETITPSIQSSDGKMALEEKKKYSSHKYSTATMTISHRKLGDLARQFAGKPIDSAIMQMAFSEKRVSNRLKSMLVVARDHAIQKGLQRDKLVVAEAWVNKGPGGRAAKRLEIKGRSKMGIRVKPKARMHVLLKEGQTPEEVQKKQREFKLKKIASAGLVREDRPLRNPPSRWAW